MIITEVNRYLFAAKNVNSETGFFTHLKGEADKCIRAKRVLKWFNEEKPAERRITHGDSSRHHMYTRIPFSTNRTGVGAGRSK